jgi:hypothetical protein
MPDRWDVQPRRSGGWEVQKEGASRASAIARTQEEAHERAREFARNAGGGEVRIKGRDGRIRDSDTIPHAHDPFPPKG